MNQLSAFNKSSSNQNEELIDQLEETLKKMADIEFMVRCCLNVTLTDLKRIRKLLLLARTVIQNNLGHQLEQSLMVSVSLALHRLDSFIFVKNELTQTQDEVEQWLQFSRSDMLGECKRLLKAGQLSGALVIWNRHQSEFELDVEQILDILTSIPTSNFGPSQAPKLAFLAKFVPDCLLLVKNQRDLAGVLETLGKWIIVTAKSLEAENRSMWPQSGIVFAQTMLDALHSATRVDDEVGLIGRGLTHIQIPLLFQEQKLSKVSVDFFVTFYKMSL